MSCHWAESGHFLSDVKWNEAGIEMQSKTGLLKLQALGDGSTELLKEYEACFGSAAAICLEDQGHSPLVEMKVSGFFNNGFHIDWEPVGDEAKRTWQDEQETTKNGACGVALLLMREIARLKAVEVSRKYNGFDFWMSSKNSAFPFKRSARLEVSGIRKGAGRKQTRLQEKIDRLKQYSNPLPAFIVVIEFGDPGVLVERK
jgi:hypothetical protein